MRIGSGTGFCPLDVRFPPVQNENWTGHRFQSFRSKVSTCPTMRIGPSTGFSPWDVRFPPVRQSGTGFSPWDVTFPPVRQWELDRHMFQSLRCKVSTCPAMRNRAQVSVLESFDSSLVTVCKQTITGLITPMNIHRTYLTKYMYKATFCSHPFKLSTVKFL